jgi:hypothetical protein
MKEVQGKVVGFTGQSIARLRGSRRAADAHSPRPRMLREGAAFDGLVLQTHANKRVENAREAVARTRAAGPAGKKADGRNSVWLRLPLTMIKLLIRRRRRLGRGIRRRGHLVLELIVLRGRQRPARDGHGVFADLTGGAGAGLASRRVRFRFFLGGLHVTRVGRARERRPLRASRPPSRSRHA